MFPDCVYRCTAGVQPPAIPKQSQEIEILLPVTDVPSFDSFIIDTLLNLLYPVVSTIECDQYIFIPASFNFFYYSTIGIFSDINNSFNIKSFIV